MKADKAATKAINELSEKLLAVLHAQHDLGGTAYPLPLQRLVELTDPHASAELIGKAVGKKPFKDQTILAAKSKPSGLVALVKDIDQLAASPKLLEATLESLCTPTAPLWPLAKVKAAVENAKLRKPFEEVVARQIRDNTLPATVGYRLDSKKKPLLYLERIPPPLPARKPDEKLADKLLSVLEAQSRLGGTAYPLPLQRLVELTDPHASADLVGQAVGKKPFKDQTILAAKSKPSGLVALAKDIDQLAASAKLLEATLESLCTPAAPLCPLAKVKKAIENAKLRKPFGEAVSRQVRDSTLPPTVGFRPGKKDNPLLYLERMPPLPPGRKPEEELAEKLLTVLEAQRRLGGVAYPLPLQRVVELTDPHASAEQIGKAVTAKKFKEAAIVAAKVSIAAPVALVVDVQMLAESPLLFDFVLASVCTLEKPTATIAAVIKKVDSRLRGPFETALKQRIAAKSLPPTVECLTVGKTQLLHPKDLPLPKEPAEVLAEKLLSVLDAQRRLGGNAYPVSIQRLIELTAPTAADPLVTKALALPALRDKLVQIDAKNRDIPVAYSNDRDQLLASSALLEFLLGSKRTATAHAFPVNGFFGPKSLFNMPFAEALERQIDTGTLPSTVGWMWVGKKKHVFFLKDVHHSSRAPEPVKEPEPPRPPSQVQHPANDFTRDFDEAFTRIDRLGGAHNFVSLVELRKAVPLPIDQFNAELRALRVAGRYTLSAAEGRHGISPAEREAGITEDGSLLLYVSRKKP